MPYTPAGNTGYYKRCVFCGDYVGLFPWWEIPYCLDDYGLWACLAWGKEVYYD